MGKAKFAIPTIDAVRPAAYKPANPMHGKSGAARKAAGHFDVRRSN